MNDTFDKKYKKIIYEIRKFEEDYNLILENQKQVSNLKFDYVGKRTERYWLYRDKVLLDGSKLQRSLKRQLNFLKKDIGQSNFSELKKCFSATNPIRSDLLFELGRKGTGQKLDEYKLIYKFFIKDCEKYNALVKALQKKDNSINYISKISTKSFFNEKLFQLSLYFIERGRVNYDGLFELIWNGTYKGKQLLFGSDRFLQRHSKELTGSAVWSVGSNSKKIKEQVRLRLYRFKRKNRLQNEKKY